MTVDVISRVVMKCESISMKIRGLGFDCGNKTFLREVKFKEFNNKIVNPADPSRYIWLFPCVPHLIKLFRNHCLDKGYQFTDTDGNIHILNKESFREIFARDGQELQLCHKIKDLHLEAKGSQRQRVFAATQLFSDSVAKAFVYHGKDFLGQTIQTVDRWFDTMNSRMKYTTVKYRCAYGINQEVQLEALEEMKKLVSNMSFVGKEHTDAMLPFQQGILVSIESTKELFEHMKAVCGITYLLTTRLNNDICENKFSQVRGIGGQQTHPGPVAAMNRLRSLLIIKNAEFFVEKPAVMMEADNNGDVPEQFREQFLTFDAISEPIQNEVR